MNGDADAKRQCGTQSASAHLTYHEIVQGTPKDKYAIGVSAFRDHMELISGIDRDRPVVTFDDGHISQYREALPILDEFGIKAIFFVTAGWIGRRGAYMEWRYLRELEGSGHKVESHGWSHEYLTRCSDKLLREEIGRSRAALEDNLCAPVTSISMPGGRWDQRTTAACGSGGYRFMYTSDPWLGPVQNRSVIQIGRFMVKNDMDRRHVLQMMSSRARAFDSLRLRHELKRVVRTLVGDRIYDLAWRRATRRQMHLK